LPARAQQTKQRTTIAGGWRSIFDILSLSGNRQVTSHVNRLSSMRRMDLRQIFRSGRKVAVCSAEAWSIVVAKLLDGAAWLRRMVIQKVIVEGYRFDQLMHDNEALEDFIRTAEIGVWHASYSCGMGADDDPMAVTDNQGRVRGVAAARRRRALQACRAPTPIFRL
jgi:choline dehydrogenase-like flavoprotein